jgi:hypothetical protein
MKPASSMSPVISLVMHVNIYAQEDSTSPAVDIWSDYVKDATTWDKKMIEGWTQSMDRLLVFVRRN